MDPEAYLEMANTETCHWWFLGRRAILSYLIAALDLPPGAKILEIGSGTGGNLPMLSSFGSVCALEVDETARTIANERTYHKYDIRQGSCPVDIPFLGEKFNLICLFDVLEHIDKDSETLIMAKSLLADGGKLLITVPAYLLLWSVHDRFLHHKRRYSASDLRQMASASDLHVMKLSYFNMFLFPLMVTGRMLDRVLGCSVASGKNVPPAFFNRIFTSIFGLERFFLSKICFPFGGSLICILQKKCES